MWCRAPWSTEFNLGTADFCPWPKSDPVRHPGLQLRACSQNRELPSRRPRVNKCSSADRFMRQCREFASHRRKLPSQVAAMGRSRCPRPCRSRFPAAPNAASQRRRYESCELPTSMIPVPLQLSAPSLRRLCRRQSELEPERR